MVRQPKFNLSVYNSSWHFISDPFLIMSLPPLEAQTEQVMTVFFHGVEIELNSSKFGLFWIDLPKRAIKLL